MNDPLRNGIRSIVVVPIVIVVLVFSGCLATMLLRALVSHVLHREFWQGLAHFVVGLISVVPLAIPGLILLAFWAWLVSDQVAPMRHRRGRQVDSFAQARSRVGSQARAATGKSVCRSDSNFLHPDHRRP